MSYINTPFPERTETENQDDLWIDSNFRRFKRYPTPHDVLKYGLRGLPKKFPLTGEDIDDEYVSEYLSSTVSSLEMNNMVISPTRFNKQDDFHEGAWTSRYFPVLVEKWPILSVEKIALHYPHANTSRTFLKYEIPKDWITFDRNRINILAATGFLAPQVLNYTNNTPIAVWTKASYRPSAFDVEYNAGFERDKLPYAVWKLIVDSTTLAILTDVGPLLFPVGGMSVGIDSVSQSASLPGPDMLMNRIKLLEQSIEKNKALITAYFGQTINISFAGL